MLTADKLLAMLQKAGILSNNTGGLLTTETMTAFIRTTIDQSQFLKEIRSELNIGVARRLDSLGVASRLMYKPTIGTAATDLLGLSLAYRTLTPVEVILPYSIDMGYLEENIERQGAEAAINDAFSKQFSNDLVDLCWNGDIANNGADKKFLNILDGILTTLQADGDALEYDRQNSTDWKDQVFPGVFKMLPEKYRNMRDQLKIYVNIDCEQEYRTQLAGRETPLGDLLTQAAPPVSWGGMRVQNVPGIPYGSVVITTPQNLASGYGRDMSVYRMLVPRARLIEYTITARVDFDYVLVNLLAFCV